MRRKKLPMKVSGINLHIGYGRVSPDVDLDAASQQRLLGFRAQELGVKLTWLEEPSVSRDADKPLKNGILEAISQGRVKTLLVYALDRFVYGATDFESVWKLCKDHEVRFIAIRDGIDSENPVCEIVGVLLASLAKMEHQKIKIRTKDKLAWTRKFIPLGGKMIEGKRYVTPKTKEKIDSIKASAASGISTRKLASIFHVNFYKMKWIIETPKHEIMTKAELMKSMGIKPGFYSLKVEGNKEKYGVK